MPEDPNDALLPECPFCHRHVNTRKFQVSVDKHIPVAEQPYALYLRNHTPDGRPISRRGGGAIKCKGTGYRVM